MKKLSIPEHITLDREYIPGIGKRELPGLLISVIPGLLVAVTVWLFAKDPGPQLIAMIGGIGYVMCCYAVFARVDKQQSIYTFLFKIIRFGKNQNKFYYKQEKEAICFAEEKQK